MNTDPIEIIHTADTHLGYTQYHNETREMDFENAFIEIITDAIESDVDAVIHSGDLFHHSKPNYRALSVVTRQLNRLDENGIPFIAIVGNHDASRDGKWIDLFEEFDIATYIHQTSTTIENDNGTLGVAFYGFDYTPVSKRSSVSYDYDTPQLENSNGTMVDVFVTHGSFEPIAPGKTSLGDIFGQSNIDFDISLLGDDHRNIVEVVGGFISTYSGASERTASDQPPGSYNKITIGKTPTGNDYSFDEDEYKLSNDLYATISKQQTQSRSFVEYEIPIEDEHVSVEQKIRSHIDTHSPFNKAVVLYRVVSEDGVESTETIPISDLETHATDSGGALVCIMYDDRNVSHQRDVEIGTDFIDPDQAVQNRLVELGVSDSYMEIDSIIRNDGVAKTNVDDVSEKRVSEIFAECGEGNVTDS